MLDTKKSGRWGAADCHKEILAEFEKGHNVKLQLAKDRADVEPKLKKKGWVDMRPKRFSRASEPTKVSPRY